MCLGVISFVLVYYMFRTHTYTSFTRVCIKLLEFVVPHIQRIVVPTPKWWLYVRVVGESRGILLWFPENGSKSRASHRPDDLARIVLAASYTTRVWCVFTYRFSHGERKTKKRTTDNKGGGGLRYKSTCLAVSIGKPFRLSAPKIYNSREGVLYVNITVFWILKKKSFWKKKIVLYFTKIPLSRNCVPMAFTAESPPAQGQ